MRSPTALLTPKEREKIFLEVHIQNVTQETIHFERLSFEPTEEWQVQDPNVTPDNQSIFSGPLALVNPQDIRQYIFILSPTSTSALRPLAIHPPGSILPLGRLNIVWRSSYGEPGRLLTSMLTRRTPLVNPGLPSSTPQPSHPASAVPPHLKRERDRASAPVPSRPQSPNPQSRPGTPPPRRPQSPALNTHPQGGQQPSPTVAPTPSLDAHLTLRGPLPSFLKAEEPFTLAFTLHVNTISPGLAGRVHLFAIQHVLPSPTNTISTTSAPAPIVTVNTSGGQGTGTGYNTPRTILSPTSTLLTHHSQNQSITSQATAQKAEVTSPRGSLSVLSSGFSTPTATSSRGTPGNPVSPGSFNYSLARQKLLVASPRQRNQDFYATHDDGAGGVGAGDSLPGEEEEDGVIYPPPYPLTSSTTNTGTQIDSGSGLIVPVGASSFTLPPLTFTPRHIPPHPSVASSSAAVHASHPSTSTIDSVDSEMPEKEDEAQQQLYISYDFELTYLPLRAGFYSAGGVRILYLGEGEQIATSVAMTGHTGLEIQTAGKPQSEKKKAQIVKEYDVVAEMFVSC